MSKKIAVTNTEPRLLILKTIQLLPGVNFVDEKTFNEEIKLADYWVKTGMVEVNDDTEEEGADASDLKSYSVRKAKVLVKETVNEEVLKGWLETEERSSLIEEINKQLKKLEDAVSNDEK